MIKLKKAVAAVTLTAMLLSCFAIPTMAADPVYEKVTSTAAVTSYYYQYGSINGTNKAGTGTMFTDDNSATMGGRGQQWDIVWIDLGEAKRIDAVKVQINDNYMSVPTDPMVFYVSNAEPGADVASSIAANSRFVVPNTWTAINGTGKVWTTTGINEELCALSTGGDYRYVICTSPTRDFVNNSAASSVGMCAYVSEIIPYKDTAAQGGSSGEGGAQPPDTSVELATNRAAFAYGSQDNTSPELALDGDTSTYWKSTGTTGSISRSIVIDLGADCKISKYAIIPQGNDTAINLKVYGATETSPDKRVYHKELLKVFNANVGKSLNDTSLGYVTWDGTPTFRYITIETSNQDFAISEISIKGTVADGSSVTNAEKPVRVTDAAKLYASNEKTKYDLSYCLPSNREYLTDTDPSTGGGLSYNTENATVRMIADLGMALPVSYVAFQVGGSGLMEEYGQNVTLAASNTLKDEYNQDDWDVLGFVSTPTFSDGNTGLLVFEVPQAFKSNKYRYIAAIKDRRYAGSGDTVRLKVNSLYAYSTESGIENAINAAGSEFVLYDETAGLQSGTLSYTAKTVAKSGAHTIVGLFGARAEDGSYDEAAYAKSTVTRARVGYDKFEISKSVTSNGTWEGVFLNGLKVVAHYIDMLNKTKLTAVKKGTAAAPTLSRLANTLTFTGKANGAAVGMVVLKPNADFASYTDADIAWHDVIYAPENASTEWSFTFNYTFEGTLPTGDYKVGFFCDNGDAAISGKTFTAKKLDVSAVVEAFRTVSADGFSELLTRNTAFFGDIAAELGGKATMGQSFVLARDAMLSGGLDASVTAWNEDTLAKTAQAALVVDKTLNETGFASGIKPYLTSMPSVFGKDYTEEEFEQIVPAILADTVVTTADELVELYKKANALCLIANGTVSDVENAIKNNYAVLGIKAETMNRITPLQVAKKLNTSMTQVLTVYVKGMDSTIKAIADGQNQGGEGTVLGNTTGQQSGKDSSSGAVAYKSNEKPIYDNTVSQENSGAETGNKGDAVFSDITGFEWASKAILTLAEKGIINGKGNGCFDPDGVLTREEAVKILVTACGMPTDESYNGYSDCVMGSWYYPYITAAKVNDLVTGFSRTNFGLGTAVTREDLAVMIYRAMKKSGITDADFDAKFTDEAQISDYAVEAVRALGGMKLLTGFDDGSFAPKALATRAETAVIFARYLDFTDKMKEAAE